MKTLFLGAYGFGNLGDELCLIEAMQSFPSDEAWVRSVDSNFTGRVVSCSGFIPWEPVAPSPDYLIPFERVVLGGGGIINKHGGQDYLAWLRAAQKSGAKTYIHNVGVTGNDTSWITPEVRETFNALDGFSARDKQSIATLRRWGITRDVSLAPFPETEVPADMSLADRIETSDILGVSMTNAPVIWEMIEKNEAFVRKTLEPFRHMKVLPIISTVHHSSSTEDDIVAFRRFYEQFLNGQEILLPETLDREWWYQTMTPEKLKGLISKCDLLFSRRKHNCLHAIACGVPTIGIQRRGNLGVGSVFNSLRHRVPKGSVLITF